MDGIGDLFTCVLYFLKFTQALWPKDTDKTHEDNKSTRSKNQISMRSLTPSHSVTHKHTLFLSFLPGRQLMSPRSVSAAPRGSPAKVAAARCAAASGPTHAAHPRGTYAAHSTVEPHLPASQNLRPEPLTLLSLHSPAAVCSMQLCRRLPRQAGRAEPQAGALPGRSEERRVGKSV